MEISFQYYNEAVLKVTNKVMNKTRHDINTQCCIPINYFGYADIPYFSLSLWCILWSTLDTWKSPSILGMCESSTCDFHEKFYACRGDLVYTYPFVFFLIVDHPFIPDLTRGVHNGSAAGQEMLTILEHLTTPYFLRFVSCSLYIVLSVSFCPRPLWMQSVV